MSRYKALRERDISNRVGYAFEGRILINTTSEKIWNNKNVAQFGVYLEKIINHWINSVKAIKRHKNYLVEKDTTAIN